VGVADVRDHVGGIRILTELDHGPSIGLPVSLTE